MPHDGPIASFSDVSYRYDSTPDAEEVLSNVNLEIAAEDFIGLIGPNGGGKTTLLRLLLGLLEPTEGTVRVLGRPPREVSRHVGYVPQYSQVDAGAPATVLDVVLTGRIGASRWGFRYGKADVAAARAAMEESGVAEFSERGIGELSGGQRQRVLIARALAAEARILLLDEPMAGIDLHLEQGILETLKRLNATMPIVLVSHDVGFVSAHVKRVACLNRRLAVHAPGAITKDIIAEMYANSGPVQALGHSHACPFALEPGGEQEAP